MSYCTKCGATLDANSQFCPSCGAPTNLAQQSPPTWTPPPMQTATQYGDPDRYALGKIKTAGLLGIIGLILGVAIPIFTLPAVFSFASPSNPSTQFSATAAGFAIDAGIGIVGFVIGLVSIYLIRSAFKTLVPADRRFSTPATLALGVFAGLILFIVTFIALIAVVLSIAGQSAANPSATPNFAGIFAVIGIFGLAAVATLIGIIGIILGLYRAGERYDEGLLKIGGILYIIPVVNIVAPILMYLGASNAEKRVKPA